MNPGATAERVLDALRGQVLSAAWRPGERLDPGTIASQLASSITPVRDALNRLTGEGLVEARPGGGFHLPALDEPLLTDLYRWSEQLLRICIANWPAGPAASRPDRPFEAGDTSACAATTAEFFAALARRSGNSAHVEAVASLNARLHVVRTVETAVLGQDGNRFADWVSAIENDDRRGLVRAIARYHRQRQRVAASVVRAVYRGG